MLVQQHNVNILGVQKMQKHFNSKLLKPFGGTFKIIDSIDVGDGKKGESGIILAIRNDLFSDFKKMIPTNKKSNHVALAVNETEKLIFGTLYIPN